MAYPCNDWEQIMQTELDGTFYTERRYNRNVSHPKRHLRSVRRRLDACVSSISPVPD